MIYLLSLTTEQKSKTLRTKLAVWPLRKMQQKLEAQTKWAWMSERTSYQ